MSSDSEHTNKQRSPQQAKGRNWPILGLLLGMATLALSLTACGGESSTSTPDTASATTPASTATALPTPTSISTPASTPTPKPTETTAVGASTGAIRGAQEYMRAYMDAQCAIYAVQRPATWGEAADLVQKSIDWVEKNKPPEELRDFLEASVAVDRLTIRFAEERRSLSYEDEEAQHAYNDEYPERDEAYNTLIRAQETLDDAVMKVIQSGC